MENPRAVDARLERRQTHVAAFLELERLMRLNPDYDANDPLVRRCLEALPEAIRLQTRDALDDYRNYVREAREAERALRKEARLAQFNLDAEGLGAFLFFVRTGDFPRGSVSFDLRESCWIVSLADVADYRNFFDPNLSNKSTNPSEKDRTKKIEKSGGLYHRPNIMLSAAPSQAGRYVDAGTVAGYAPAVLLVRKRPTDEGFEQIVAHEYQHHVNHDLLHLFRRAEKRQKPPEQRERESWVKDELLAYIRDGATGNEVEDAMLGTLYDELFVHPVYGKQMKDEVRAVAAELRKKSYVLGVPEARQALVYHLLDVPLSEMAQRLAELAVFFNKRLEQTETTFAVPDKLTDPTVFFPPGAARQAQRKSADAYSRLEQASDEVWGSVFLASKDAFDEQIKEKSEKEQALRDAATPLRRDGVLVPYAQVFGEPTRELRNSVDRVLADLMRLPPSVIDQLVDVARDAKGMPPSFADEPAIQCIRQSLEAGGANEVVFHDPRTPYGLAFEIRVDWTPRHDPSKVSTAYLVLYGGKPQRVNPDRV